MLKVYEWNPNLTKLWQLSIVIMQTIYGVCVISSLLLISQSSLNKGLAQAGNLWYVGDGAKNDMYVTYRVQEQDTNAGRPFEMTIYFKNFNSTGNYWDAPTFVVDQGRVYNGTFHLSDLDLTALGSSQISPEMAKYRSAYSSSLKWLSAFVSKPGQSLTAQNWGKIASIGGSPITPSGKATLPHLQELLIPPQLYFTRELIIPLD